ncbi:hypothetical protein E1264_39655 [Actinomadura sp. KC216]|nr:hypothetical protein E1264_39655 [Actinomadura sp. KC216]
MIAMGYQHSDVLTAALVQDNGRPEPISTFLAAVALRRSPASAEGTTLSAPPRPVTPREYRQ